jgi:hypothetical protein
MQSVVYDVVFGAADGTCFNLFEANWDQAYATANIPARVDAECPALLDGILGEFLQEAYGSRRAMNGKKFSLKDLHAFATNRVQIPQKSTFRKLPKPHHSNCP